MIESEQMKQKEEEEKKYIGKSKKVLFYLLLFIYFFLDIKQPNSQWKPAEPTNDILRKFRNYEI